MDSRPIGVLDSGVGGISVLRQLVRLMPEENYLYYGDSAHAPYGGLPTEKVQQLTLQVVMKLRKRGIKALVVACNTATAASIDLLRQQFPDMPVVGIEPALKMAADRFPHGHIGVMATCVTLREEKFARQTERFPELQIERIPAPGLVELVEAGQGNGPEAEALLRKILGPYVGKLDALVLGCTHYPFAAEAVSRVLGNETLLMDGSEGTARQTKHCLQQAGLFNQGSGSVQIENSLEDPNIITLCRKLLTTTGG